MLSGELLIQKRAATKLTFPKHVTNSCCSHPLMEYPEEQITTNHLGVKVAARRKLEQELGIAQDAVDLDDLQHVGFYIYRFDGDGVWGEHELAHIMILQVYEGSSF